MPFIESLYMQMVWAYLFALATPLVLWASSRLPIEKNNWIRSALLHVPISIVLGVASNCARTRFYLAEVWLSGGQTAYV